MLSIKIWFGINDEFPNKSISIQSPKIALYSYPAEVVIIELEKQISVASTFIELKSNGIATGCHYTPLNMQPLFKKYSTNCPIAENEYMRMITLPLHVDITFDEIDYIIDKIKG